MTTITLHDPRHMDGDPHEVAELAGSQLTATLEHALAALKEFSWAARGAWMTAEEHVNGEMPRSEKFWDSPQGIKIMALSLPIEKAIAEAKVLTTAASYNPRAPIGKHE
jgi:hypothetical protein